MRERDAVPDFSPFVVALVFYIAVVGIPLRSQQTGSDTPVTTIFSRVVPSDCNGPTDDELAAVKSAIESFRTSKETENEARALALLGTLYENKGRYSIAIPYLLRSLDLYRQANNHKDEVHLRIVLADAYNHRAQYDVALKYVDQAVSDYQLMDDSRGLESALTMRGEVSYSNDTVKAMADFEAARMLSETVGDLKSQAIILNDEAASYGQSGDPAKSIETGKHALIIAEQIHDCREKGAALANVASSEQDRGQTRQAVDDYNESLQLQRQAGDQGSEAETLHGLAKLHQDVGNLPEALSLFLRAHLLESQTGNSLAEGPTLVSIAGVYRDMGKPTQALSAYLQAFPLLEKSNDQQSQIVALNNLGAVEADLRNQIKARGYYKKAIQKAIAVGDPVTPAYSAWGIGELEQSDALTNYFRALRLARELNQPDLEGLVDSSLMGHFRIYGLRNVAIFFGKQAVDKFQSIRRNMGGLSEDILSSFLQKKSDTYRTLAELLIDEGRLIEAQQVLDLLKIQQYSDYVRSQPNELSSALIRSPNESRWGEKYNQKFSALVALDEKLKPKENIPAKPDSQIVRDSASLRAAESEFKEFVQFSPKQLEANTGTKLENRDETDAQSSLDQLLAGDPHTVALYTLSGGDRYRIIAITHSGRFWRPYSISQNALDAKCVRFLKMMKDHQGDINAAAQELFKIIFGPVQDDIEKMKATTLVWSLDGPLRYIPLGALRNPVNGRYLIEDYSIVNYTPLGHSHAEVPKLSGASGIAMGISTSYDSKLGALPNVKSELDDVVTDRTVKESHGLLPGTILLNEKFTQAAMEQKVRSQTIVHIASHFVLEPGNDGLSFLLLGGKDKDAHGYRFSMADFKLDRQIDIEGTELVTLSACETGAENKRDDGVVMEGMTEAVLDRGAKAVISSLWAVNDESTAIVMADFYEKWIGSAGKRTKAEALREAELGLLRGKVHPVSGTSSRGIKPDDSTVRARFADPFYWAAFVLMGNWQ